MAIGDVWKSIPQEPSMAMWIQCLIESNSCMSEVVDALLNIIPLVCNPPNQARLFPHIHNPP